MGQMYTMLLANLRSKAGDKLGQASLNMYRSHVNKLLRRHGLTAKDDVQAKHFSYLNDHSDSDVGSSERSALTTIYRNYIIKEVEKNNLDTLGIISLCLQGRVNKDKLERLGCQLDARSLLSELRRKPKIASLVADALFIPATYIALREVNTEIPEDWLDEASGQLSPKQIEDVEHLFLAENLDSDNEIAKEVFDSIVKDVILGDYHNGSHYRIAKYKKDMNYKEYRLVGEQRKEFDLLVAYKKSFDMQLRNKSWSDDTIGMHEKYLQRYYGYLYNIRSEDIDRDEIDMSLLTDADLIIDFLNHRKEISGSYNTFTRNFLVFVESLINLEDGWLVKQKHYSKKIRNRSANFKDWEKHILALRDRLKTYRKYIESLYRPTRNTKSKYKVILDNDSPIDVYMKGIEESFLELEARYSRTRVFAYEAQEFVLAMLTICFPLRSAAWAKTKFDIQMKKHGIVKNRKGEIKISIDVKHLKNKSTSKMLKNITRWEFPLSYCDLAQKYLPFIEKFFKELRPLINNTEYLFIEKNTGTISSDGIGRMISNWSEKYLSSHSVFSSKVRGLPAFRSHLIRSIVATHFAKRNQIGIAAYLLCDSEDTIRKAYVKDDINTMGERIFRQGLVDYGSKYREYP